MVTDTEDPGKPESTDVIWTVSQGRRLRDLRLGRGLRQQGWPRWSASGGRCCRTGRRVRASHQRRISRTCRCVQQRSANSDSAAGETITPTKPADSWAALRAPLAEVVPSAEQLRIDWFLSQVTLFHRLAGDAELTAFRWARQRAVSEPYRVEVAALAGTRARTSGPAWAAGAELARDIREQLGLSRPLCQHCP